MLTQTLAANPALSPENVRSLLAQSMMIDGFDLVLDLHKSKGARLYDSLHDKTMLDFFTFFASAPIGMNHPKLWNDKAFLDKLLYAAIVNPSNSDVYSVEMAEFVDTFRKLAMPKEMKYTFWIAGGTLGIENAIKAAFDWKVKKNFKKGYKTERGHQVLHFKQAFHGRSGYTLSMTNTDPNKTDYFPKFEWPRVSNPKITFPLTEERLVSLEKAEKDSLNEIKKAFKENKDDIAAILIEPIQGEGGDNHFRPEFLKALRLLTLENDAMLIFDEVQTGLGLTGTMWASQQLLSNGKPCTNDSHTCADTNCVAQESKLCMPDMIAFGKKMQVCGFMCSERIDEVADNVFHVPSRINSTWGGSLADMLRSKKFIEIIAEEHLVENAANVGAFLLSKVQLLAEEFKRTVTSPRGRGLMCAFDVPSKEFRTKFLAEARKNGLMIVGCGDNTVRFRPPLSLTIAEAEEGIGVIRNALKHTL
jgi:L-lysine 6-transaminase